MWPASLVLDEDGRLHFVDRETQQLVVRDRVALDQSLEALRRSEEALEKANVARRQAEARAEQEAQARREAERRLEQMTAEIERLRAELDERDDSA